MARIHTSLSVADGDALKGLRNMQKRLPRAIRERVLVRGAREIARAARKSALFTDKTGTLRRAIRVVKETRKKAARANEEYVIVRAKAPHAPLVEFGHGGPPPRAPASVYAGCYQEVSHPRLQCCASRDARRTCTAQTKIEVSKHVN